MPAINRQFALQLKASLNGQFAPLEDLAESLSPAQALSVGIDADVVAACAAGSLRLECVGDLKERPASTTFIETIPIAYARRHCLLGLADAGSEMPVASADVGQWPLLQTLSRVLGRPLRMVLASRQQIMSAINAAYQLQGGQAQQLIEKLDEQVGLGDLSNLSGGEDLLDVAAKAPVIKLVNMVLFEAVKRRASDVHVQPYEDCLVVRFRVDGVLYDIFKPPKGLQEEMTSRIKVMGGMNIAERRLAQDGRATVEVGDRLIDLRIATLPTSFGERTVIRLLDKSARLYKLAELGMDAQIQRQFSQLIQMDHGIVLVTGPTGSGKSTTLYAALGELNSTELNIITLEDPIEYRLDGISQTQVSDRKGMTFASGLRHVLRQDPDIIMLGEIRDAETAHMAIQSALTGHLVFSTLHTNDAAGAVARMLDLGVEPYLLASSLLGVLAQRLVRRICPNCRQALRATQSDWQRWGLDGQAADHPIYAGRGCDECMQTGFHGRIGLFELLTASEPLREHILARAKASSIKASAVREGMTTLRQAGIDKALHGLTTMGEVARVTGLQEF